jgi:ACR3 family arsenite efflux pump ArsB
MGISVLPFQAGAFIGVSDLFELAVVTPTSLSGPGSGAALTVAVGTLVVVPAMLAI